MNSFVNYALSKFVRATNNGTLGPVQIKNQEFMYEPGGFNVIPYSSMFSDKLTVIRAETGSIDFERPTGTTAMTVKTTYGAGLDGKALAQTGSLSSTVTAYFKG